MKWSPNAQTLGFAHYCLVKTNVESQFNSDKLFPEYLHQTYFKLRPEFFYYMIYEPSYCNFPESRKKIK